MAKKKRRRRLPPRDQRPTLVTPEGDPLILCEASFAHNDMRGIARILGQAADFGQEEPSDLGPDMIYGFAWYGTGPYAGPMTGLGGQRIIAGIELAPVLLQVRTMSEPRLAACRARLEELLGDRIVWLRAETKSPVQALLDSPPDDQPELPELPPKVIAELNERMLRQWLDESIPALGGKTPREAVQTPEGRLELADLVSYIQDQQAARPQGGPWFSPDYSQVWDLLGVEPPEEDMEEVETAPELGQVLRNVQIDERGPGTILHDFQVLLDYCREHDIKLSKTHLLLSGGKLLAEINALLAEPIEVHLKRPVLKSYPNIAGLYLLLRASGLARVGGTPSTPWLHISEDAYQAWTRLNPTERYCTLLEAWILRGSGTILGERDTVFEAFPLRLERLGEFVSGIPVDGLPVDADVEMHLRYLVGLHTVALCHLFGLVTVESGAPVEGKGWRIDRIYAEPFGAALLGVLVSYLSRVWEHILDELDQSDAAGFLQPALQEYFPAWQSTLTIPRPPFRDGIHVFKVFLGRTWRRIAISGTALVEELANTILDAFDFDYDHLYEFSYIDSYGHRKQIVHPYIEEGLPADEVRVGDVPISVGAKMDYWYDFGDNWRFTVALDQVKPSDPSFKTPVILKAHGKAPKQYPSWDDE